MFQAASIYFISDASQPQLDKLEFVLGFKHLTFNVGMRSKLIHPSPLLLGCFIAHACPTVNASLHGAFNRQGWFLVLAEAWLVESLDRDTIPSPSQHVIHEISSLLLNFSSKHTSHCLTSDNVLPVSI